MSPRALVGEYEIEPVPGLPESLPEGEEIVWQGSPSWRALARRAFHTRKVAGYFGLLLLWSVASAVADATPAGEIAEKAAVLVLLASVVVGILSGIAWLSARSALFTITNRRIVLRFGMALPMAVNLPFGEIQSVDFRSFGDGTGDISLVVKGVGKLGYAVLWPFARPWRFGSRAQPMLRSLPDARAVADRLGPALTAATRPGAATRAREAAGGNRAGLASTAA